MEHRSGKSPRRNTNTERAKEAARESDRSSSKPITREDTNGESANGPRTTSTRRPKLKAARGIKMERAAMSSRSPGPRRGVRGKARASRREAKATKGSHRTI